MSSDKPQWSYNEFLAYLLLYAANADFEINEEERKLLLSGLNTYDYNKISKAFDKCNDYERLQIIGTYRDLYYPDDESKEKILNDLRNVFLADEEYNSVERAVFMGLRKVLL